MSKNSGRQLGVSRIAAIAASVLATLFVSGAAGAASFAVAGFGDSLTRNVMSGGDFDGSYLGQLPALCAADADCGAALPGLVIGDIFDGGVGGDTTGEILTRLTTFLSANTAEFVIIMGGTVDAFDIGAPYDQDVTLGNIEDMIDLVLAANLKAIVIAPPPVVAPCDGSVSPSCVTIDGRLASVEGALDSLVGSYGTTNVRFVPTRDAFTSNPGFLDAPGTGNSPYLADGLHLKFTTGDVLVTSELLTAIPEPGTGALMGLGLLGLALRRRIPRSA